MPFTTLSLQCNASGTALSTFKHAPAGTLVAASVLYDENQFALESNWASIYIGVDKDDNTRRQICLAKGYFSSIEPLTWTGRMKLSGNEILILFGRSVESSKHRAVFMIEEA